MSVNIHVIKIITWNLADVGQIIFSSDPTKFLLCIGIGIGYKSMVKFEFCAQPVYQIYVLKYCILLKTSLSEWEWVIRHKYGFHDDSFQAGKKSLPTKIFSSFALTAQPYQNIANMSD